PDNIIGPYLEKTDVGRILLAADLQMKKDLARFTSPDTAEGRQYWDKLYTKAEQVFGLEDIEIPTITRPWIVPGEIIIRAGDTGAFIYKATLKVMLEQDYLKDSPDCDFGDPRQKTINEYSSQLIRDLIIPELTREVNSSKRYAELRQVYYSLILAQWFKNKFPGGKIDSKDLTGLMSGKAWSKDTYYQAYRRSFTEGEYNKQERNKGANGVAIRQYFSGGEEFSNIVDNISVIPGGPGDPFGDQNLFFAKVQADGGGWDQEKKTGPAVLEKEAKIINGKTIEVKVLPKGVRADTAAVKAEIDNILADVDSLTDGTVLDGLEYIEPVTIVLRDFEGNRTIITEKGLRTLLRKLAANAYDGIASFHDRDHMKSIGFANGSGMPGIGRITLTARWAMHPDIQKEILEITITDNGAGKYAADTARKHAAENLNLYFGGGGLDTKMIRYGDIQTGARSLLVTLWERAGVNIPRDEHGRDDTSVFYDLRHGGDGLGTTVTIRLPKGCFKTAVTSGKDGGIGQEEIKVRLVRIFDNDIVNAASSNAGSFNEAVRIIGSDWESFSGDIESLRGLIGEETVNRYFRDRCLWFVKNLKGLKNDLLSAKNKFSSILTGIAYNEEAGRSVSRIQEKAAGMAPVVTEYDDLCASVKGMMDIYTGSLEQEERNAYSLRYGSLDAQARIALNRYNDAIARNLSSRVIMEAGETLRVKLIGPGAYTDFTALEQVDSMAGLYRFLHNKLMTDYISPRQQQYDPYRTHDFRFMPEPDIYNFSGKKELPEGLRILQGSMVKARYVVEQDPEEPNMRQSATFIAGDDGVVLVSMPLGEHRFDCLFRSSSDRPEKNFIKLSWQDGDHAHIISPVANKTRLRFVAEVLNRLGLSAGIEGWTLSAGYYVPGGDDIAAERSRNKINDILGNIGTLNKITFLLDYEIDSLFFGFAVYLNSQPLKEGILKFMSPELVARTNKDIERRRAKLREPGEKMLADIVEDLTKKFFEGKYLRGGTRVKKLPDPLLRRKYRIPEEYFRMIGWYETARDDLRERIQQQKLKGEADLMQIQEQVWREFDMNGLYARDRTLWAQLSEVWAVPPVKEQLIDWIKTGALPDMSSYEDRRSFERLIVPPHALLPAAEDMQVDSPGQDTSSRDGGRDVFVNRFLDLLNKLPVSLSVDSVLYPGSSFDVTHPLFLFDPKNMFFVDRWSFEGKIDSGQPNGLWSVAAGELIYYGSEPNAKDPMLKILKRIGAEDITITSAEQDVFVISFYWAHPRSGQSKKRSIIYINREAAEAMDLIGKYHAGPFDAYFQKASKIQETNPQFVRWALERVRPDGWVVADQPGFIPKTSKDSNKFLPRMPKMPVKFGYDSLSLWQKKSEISRAGKDGGSAGDDLAGIDLRAMPVAGQVRQPFLSMLQASQELQRLAGDSKIQDLDKEWEEIEAQMRIEEMPYSRIKEYIAVCVTRNDAGKHLDKTIRCVLNILRLEEEQALPTNAELKDILFCLR
ncbi:MAG: hypothetical protein WC547_05860, partial [Candidatus Omnitrophota bacterium]